MFQIPQCDIEWICVRTVPTLTIGAHLQAFKDETNWPWHYQSILELLQNIWKLDDYWRGGGRGTDSLVADKKKIYI